MTNTPPNIIHANGGDTSYVDWSSILSGAVVAAAIFYVFSTFGAALGLSLVSPYTGSGSVVAAIVATGSWMLWSTISSFATGGYIAGRMRRRIDPINSDEVDIRDGIHGLTVWAVAVLLGAVAISSTAGPAIDAAPSIANAVIIPGDQTGTVAENGDISKQALENVRIYSVISAFVVASALLISAASAYWAAGVGGRHRDEGTTFARFGRWI
ncbi:hypothetical protein GCM10008927_06050 [Amylibacter ulvae]|uniref:Uncharacterized protein n=1 Tax=Paramylibacter ulvae TaxID=1651968 RepID=A0ABQ3CV86_9RHOB|nr:hypothetical protein [Amylibacter ulvae]GHA44065.1 hypothetical protein GCM10008927_06050 [Amylibacter ulvae]